MKLNNLIILLSVVLFLSACTVTVGDSTESDEPYGKYYEVKVAGNDELSDCYRYCSGKRDITFEKDGNTVVLKAYDSDAQALKVGNVVNVEFDDDYWITKVELPGLEEGKDDGEEQENVSDVPE
jgi:uncharacterized protein YceK